MRRPPAERIVGASGLVTGRVSAGTVGEVLISTPRGASSYFAHPAWPGETFEVGAAIRVLEFLPPRTVRVVAG